MRQQMTGLLFLGSVLLFSGCAGNRELQQPAMRGASSSLSVLSPSEKILYQKHRNIARGITEEDRMAWMASDLVVPYLEKLKLSPETRGNYVVDGNLRQGNVNFYRVKEKNEISIWAKAIYTNGKITTKVGSQPFDSLTLKKIEVLEKSRDVNQAYLEQQRCHYNTYAFANDSSFTVYLAPESVEEYALWEGGIKSVFDQGAHLTQNMELQRSIVVSSTKDRGVCSSSNSTVLNEADLAQYLIWNKVFFNQIIVTPTYVFMLYYIPDEDRMV